MSHSLAYFSSQITSGLSKQFEWISKLNQSNLNASFYQIISFLDYKQQHNGNKQ
ncbi:hypothetical protein I6764_05045 [Helicobacter pylori]|uniref:hypothetical protein n=1 Tax=Helicobacter pylori TaxID=210 RepID=UPI0018D1769A|nr:hypothetical protein [Helicobacter pylori]MBH0273750.1 hypothetical protein [Helicobacter pylori]